MVEQSAEVAAAQLTSGESITTAPKPRAPWMLRLGIGIFILSCLSYLSLLLLPFLHVSNGTRGILFVVLVGLGEGAFWVSALLVGTVAVRRYRRYLNPRNWFRHQAGA